MTVLETMKVRFTAAFDFSPRALNGRWTQAYDAGAVETVTRECAAAAIAAGKAQLIETARAEREVSEAGGRYGKRIAGRR